MKGHIVLFPEGPSIHYVSIKGRHFDLRQLDSVFLHSGWCVGKQSVNLQAIIKYHLGNIGLQLCQIKTLTIQSQNAMRYVVYFQPVAIYLLFILFNEASVQVGAGSYGHNYVGYLP